MEDWKMIYRYFGKHHLWQYEDIFAIFSEWLSAEGGLENYLRKS